MYRKRQAFQETNGKV